MCFGCPKEPSHRDSSFEYSQHMFWLRNKKYNFLLHTLIWGPADCCLLTGLLFFRFWYLGLVACHRNTTQRNCSWYHNASIHTELNYDIWLVNGNPDSKHLNPFEHQFSFEMHDVFEIYLIFSLLYGIILPVWIFAFRQQIHPITKLLTVCISTEFAGVVFNFINVFIFSFNGFGAEWLTVIGNLLGMFAECLFVLLLLLIAKGWTITSMKLTSKYAFIGSWGFYTFLNAMFFIWNLVSYFFKCQKNHIYILSVSIKHEISNNVAF